MSASKIAIIVLILFAILFVVGVVAGTGNGDPSAALDDFPPSWLDGIGNAFSPKVDFAAITGSCIDQQAKAFVLKPGTDCKIALPAHSDDSQNLKMALTGGTKVTGQYKAPKSQETHAEQKVELQTGKRTEVTVAVLPEGGTLSLKCPKTETTACKIEVL